MSDVWIEGKKVFVTGGSTGLGRASAIALAERGAQVSLCGLPEDGLREMEAMRLSNGSGFRCFGGDLTEPAFLDRMAAEAGQVDILLNCAGRAVAAPFLDNDPADWERIFSLKVLSTFRMTQAAARGMVARGSGHIITISSALAHAVSPNTLCYAASKHALAAMHQGIRLELLGKGVRSTEIRPGLVLNTMIGRWSQHPASKDHVTGRSYAGMQPEDVARAVVYAATAPANVELDVIELKPLGQL